MSRPFDLLARSLCQRYAESDRVPVIVLPAFIHPRPELMVALIESVLVHTEGPVRLDWCPPANDNSWVQRWRRKRSLGRVRQRLSPHPVEVSLTEIVGRADQDSFRMGLAGDGADLPGWVDPIELMIDP